MPTKKKATKAKPKRVRDKSGRFVSSEPKKPAKKATPKKVNTAAAEKKAETNRRRQMEQRRASQDIGPIPTGPTTKKDKRLRIEADTSLLGFLRTCFPGAFPKPFGPDHLRLIADIERVIEHGLLKALAMPRGSGKTTVLVRAALFAIASGKRKFLGIIAATKDKAVELLEGIKEEILTNPILSRLYPAEFHCLRRLQGESRLAQGQRLDGELTGVEWKETRVKFGHAPGVLTSGAIVYCAGITGNIRGPNITLASGEVVRPDLLLVDDILTRELAAKVERNAKVHKILVGDLLGVAGPGRRIACLITGTVIYKKDAMDRLLDRKLSPMFAGDKCQMVYAWPEDETGWDEARAILENELSEGGTGSECSKFVRANFDRLHKGSRVGWKERFDPHEVSALQHAYTLRWRDEETFWSEYQNSPLSDTVEQPYELDADDLMVRTNNVPPWELPSDVERITAFIDVQLNCLFFHVLGWEMCGRGHVLAKGTYPDQGRLMFTKREVHRTLEKETGQQGRDASIWAGLEELTDFLMGREFSGEAGRRGEVVQRINHLGIDAAWGDVSDLIRRFCRESKWAGRLVPMFGHYIGAKSKPWQRLAHDKKRDVLGRHCKMVPPPRGRGVREMIVDTNYWKTYTAEKLACLAGADNAILLHAGPPHVHRMAATHYTAETSSLEESDAGTSVIEWTNPNKADEDLWDCLVGATVLSALEGVRLDPAATSKREKQEEPDREGGDEPEPPEARPDQEPTPEPARAGPQRVRPAPRAATTDPRVSEAEW